MGKLRYDPHEHHYPDQQQSKSLKAMNKSALKKSVKVTFISSPLLMRTCDASEFRSVVQQLTGKDSDDDFIISESHPHNKKVAPKSSWSNIIRVQDQPACRVMMPLQGGDDHHHVRVRPTTATTVNIEEYGGNDSSSYYNNNRAVDSSLEFDEEDYLWKEVARSVLQSPCVLA